MTDTSTDTNKGDAAIVALTQAIKSKITAANKTFTANSMFSTSVLKPPSVYRTRTIDKDEDFVLTDVKVGSRKGVLLVLTPIEPRDYLHIEISEKAISSFTDLEEFLTDAVTLEGATRESSYRKAKQSFIANFKAQEVVAEQEKKNKAKASLFSEFGDNPLFGSW